MDLSAFKSLFQSLGNGFLRGKKGQAFALCVSGFFVLLMLNQLYSAIELFANPAEPVLSAQQQQSLAIDVQPAVKLDKLLLFGEYQPPQLNLAQIPVATMNLRLQGIFFSKTGKTSQAVIADEEGTQRVYRVDDELANGAKIYRILKHKVIIRYNGELQSLQLPMPKLKFEALPKALPKTLKSPQSQ